jgi:hypothetical protein
MGPHVCIIHLPFMRANLEALCDKKEEDGAVRNPV